ncbi:MAG: hypothetical protein AOA65_1078 [Candidatus Bathyarchaeota archaeon BA1]|nr:MAG: hypothetical protein AOA65_1078 [Candidatus Bathyarchaeota archaeon BA1]
MQRIEEYLRMADEYYRKGMELFSKRNYPDAAEKIWASIKTATMALTEKYLGRISPPEGEYWGDFVTIGFIKAGVTREEAEKRAEYFIDARGKLHGECFYGLFYEEKRT